MQLGLIISVLMHVAILGGALISIQSRAELRLPETEPVAVGMISPGDVTKVRQGVRTAKLLEAEPRESPKGDQARKEAKRPTKTAAAAPPPPPPAAQEDKAEPAPPKAADPPSPAPAAEAQKKAAEEAQRKLEAEQQKQAEAQRLAEQQKQAEEQAKAEAMQRAEAQKLAEEKKRIEEEQKQAEARKRAEEEQKRLEEQRKQAELKKRKDEERRLKLARERKEKQRKAAEAAKKRKLEEEKARQEAEAAKKQFDADKIAALLNKVPDKGAPPPSAASDQPAKDKGPTLGAAEGRDQIISASERAMIRQIVMSCVTPRWTVLSGGASAQETVVKIRLRFNKDGTLSAPPVITNPQGTPYFRAISESALRAVRECEPYNLPRSLYEHWKDTIINFSPTDMF